MRKIKIFALLVVVCMLVSITGCQQESSASSGNVSDSLSKTTDIVVIGAGTAGMTAAIQAAMDGANVILLEKNSKVGGSSQFAEGVLGVDTPLQEESGIEIDKVDILRQELEFHNYMVDGVLWKAVLDQAKENIQWLLDIGTKFERVGSPGIGAQTWHVYEGLGEGFFANTLIPKAEELGVETLVETPGTELIMENGHVVGVKATTKDGQELTINCKAAIIATGGFDDNPEMVEELTNEDLSRLVNCGMTGNTGDGIKMAKAVGATSRGWAILCKDGVTLDGYPTSSHLMEAAAMEPTNLWVNENGIRFINEDVIFEYTRAGNAVAEQRKVFSIMDSAQIDKLEAEGCTNGSGAFIPPGTKLTEIKGELEQALEKKVDNVYKANTLEELAEKIGVDKDVFVESVNNYNSLCEQGTDSDYGKDKNYMNSIQTGPFYAFHIQALFFNSMGGIKANTKCEVLDQDEKPIPGLYVAGMDIDGFTGDTYGMAIPGSSQGIALYSGRNSANNAIAYMKTIK